MSDAGCIWKHDDLAALVGDWGMGPATGGQIQVNDEEGLSWDSGQDTDRCKAEEETWHLLTECCLGYREERGQANLLILELIFRSPSI